MGLNVSPYLAVPGRGGEVGSAAQASKEMVHIIEGVFKAPEQGLQVVFDVGIPCVQSWIGNGVGQLS